VAGRDAECYRCHRERGLRRLLMGYIEKQCWKLLNAAWHTHPVFIIIVKGFGDALLD